MINCDNVECGPRPNHESPSRATDICHATGNYHAEDFSTQKKLDCLKIINATNNVKCQTYFMIFHPLRLSVG